MSRSKEIGTHAESAVVTYLRAHGFAQAERRALAGSSDLGDITGLGPIVIEVKAGKAAELAAAAGTEQISQWLAETHTETRNADADFGLLVCKRVGRGDARVGDWWVYVDSETYMSLHAHPVRPWCQAPLVKLRLTLAEAVAVLRYAGYGDEAAA